MKSINNTLSDRQKELFIFLGLFLFCLFILFYGLGRAALFEPTEGRNAEIAREILLTHDWITPHDDFIPVLDKPIFLHWLIAIGYKLFGLSEWAARLPSALAGLGSVILVYLFARKFLGLWEGLWSGLILLTSLQFFALSRIVLFDMPLTFFITLSLCCFYWGMNCADRRKKQVFYLAMYAAMGVAMLIKGPIGVVVPAMVILPYVVILRKWFLLRELHVISGVILFLIIVAPWYVWVDIRNPGYLRYFLWEENFIRFLTRHFGRGERSYYFLEVLAVGFLPWTFFLPHLVKAQWKRPVNEPILFLLLWTGLPFLFFSFSHTKLSHYILPIYPALAILAGEAVARSLKERSQLKRWPLWFPSVNLFLLLVMLAVAAYRPEILPNPLQGAMREALHDAPDVFILGAILGIIWLALATVKAIAKSQASLYLFCCAGFALYFCIVDSVVAAVALASSSKVLAQKSASLIKPGDQLVIYDSFRSSLPYYLKVERPIWVVWSGHGDSVMESYYIVEKRPQPAAIYGKALITFEQFAELREVTKKRLLVFVKKKNIPRFIGKNGTPAETLLDFDDYVLMSVGDSERGRTASPGH
jgi:4-amino-4-deoxy-L-arabinose transferase-like glycosyltransferase